ncbi:MAG: recombination mediator RecR [Ignavibacteria bacterium]|jgi:recombination protein RecR|nr:recombination mediator RecR [Ignavibacteria bacterium]
MHYTSETIERAVDMFASLPSIGRKTAQRLVYHILRTDKTYADNFSNAILALKEKVLFCEQCFNYSEVSPCPICSSNKRNGGIICVVADPNDVLAIEKTNEFNGKYHVLHGILNPLEGVTANDLKIKELIARLTNIDEVILAINPSVEGEVTIQYLAKMITPLNIKVSRIASGIPIGSAIEYSDEATLARALEARIAI